MIGDAQVLAGVPATAAWVWQAGPRPVGALDGVFVRCANGASGSGAGGFDFARNWRDWKASRRARAVPWTWFGPPASSNGSACADVLHQIAPAEPAYIVEIECDPPPEQVLAFVRRMRKLEPGARLGFTSYPTRAEAEGRGGVPWETCVAAFDFGLPQVYTARQRAALLGEASPVVADMQGKPIHVAVFPDADAHWTESARAGLRHLGVSAWAIDQTSFDTWHQQLAALPRQPHPGADLPATGGPDVSGPRHHAKPAAHPDGPGAATAVPGSQSRIRGPRHHHDPPAHVEEAQDRSMTGSPGDEDMPISDADAEKIAARVAAKLAPDVQAARSVADSVAIADLKGFLNAKTDELARRIIAVIQEHTGVAELSDDRLVAAIKRALREGMGP
jgi:hypothetical protein